MGRSMPWYAMARACMVHACMARRPQDEGVDLVLVNPKTDPPLCRLVEWGK